MTPRLLTAVAAVAAVAAATLANADDGRRSEYREPHGAVYTMTNEAAGNAILVFDRLANGRLVPASRVPTGGNGTGAGLGNQGGLVLSSNGRWLLTVNAASNSVSLFEVRSQGLRLADVVSSGGDRPISVTEHHGVVYVLHSGTDTIAGFAIDHGRLSPIPGAVRGLSGTGVGPAQIAFAPDGDRLLVTEKATNLIVSYPVDRDGVAGTPQVQASNGVTPFGFAFGKRDQVFVSEAFGGAPSGAATSSYRIEHDGTLATVSASIATNQTAACWAAVTPNGRYLYVTNAGSGVISGYRVAFDGELALLDPDGRTGITGPGSTPLDMAIADGGRVLYVLNGGSHSIGAFRIGPAGALTALPVSVPVPGAANGLAVR